MTELASIRNLLDEYSRMQYSEIKEENKIMCKEIN